MKQEKRKEGTSLTTSAEILDEEAKLRFPNFGSEDALAIGLRLLERAKADATPIAIHIGVGRRILFHYECDGTAPDNSRWIEMKARVTEMYGHSSYYMSCLLEENHLTVADWQLDPQRFSVSGGCFPILLQSGLCIGHISVSGYTPQGDHEAVVSAVRYHLEKGTKSYADAHS